MNHDLAINYYGKGIIYKDEAKLLLEYSLFAASPVVEVGTLRGGTALLLAMNLWLYSREAIVISIDKVTRWHRTYNKWLQKGNIDLLELKRLFFLKGDACQIIEDQDIKPGMVFLDGCHCYDCVMKDIAQLRDRIQPGGYWAFHDIALEGSVQPKKLIHGGRLFQVAKAITDSALNEFSLIDETHNMHVYQKHEPS